MASLELDRRYNTFNVEFRRLFSPSRRISYNLLTFHRTLLDKLTEHNLIVYTNSHNAGGNLSSAMEMGLLCVWTYGRVRRI